MRICKENNVWCCEGIKYVQKTLTQVMDIVRAKRPTPKEEADDAPFSKEYRDYLFSKPRADLSPKEDEDYCTVVRWVNE